MKFARYLEETQTPEWKKAYIDYRGLKKKITAIRRADEAARASQAQEARAQHRSSVTEPSPSSSGLRRRSYGAFGRTPPGALGKTPSSAATRTPPSILGHNRNKTDRQDRTPLTNPEFSPPGTIEHASPPTTENKGTSIRSPRFRMSVEEVAPDFQLPPAMESVDSLKNGTIDSHAEPATPSRAVPSRFFNERLSVVTSRSETLQPEPVAELRAPAPITPITPIAPANEPTRAHGRMYSLSGMRRRFTQSSRHNDIGYSPPAPSTVEELLSGLGPNEMAFFTAVDQEIDKVDKFYSEREQDAILKVTALKQQFHELKGHKELSGAAPEGLWPGFINLVNSINIPALPTHHANKSPDTSVKTGTPQQPNTHLHAGQSLVHDPEAYQRAKKKLKKAVLEFYRGLELLQNYRILNLTGFRKALKKFDKATKVSSQNLYMRERVETRSFASGDICAGLLKEIEHIYATRFERGDEKKARIRLRATPRESTHHFSTFRSGMFIGLAIPALAMGIYYSLQEELREEIPEWAALLQVYAALCIPVIFSLSLGLNLVAWARARINFIFIFELDARTVIDAREYVELPAFLFTTLCYAFWLSFSRAGAETVASTTWPIIWVGLAAAVLVNPLPLFHRSARWWLLRTVGKLFVSGRTRVEFTDFWMGDQLCSLVFTMGNLYFLICAYADSWHHIEERCQLGPHWTIPLVLSVLPSFIRLVQCIRRWVDSKNQIHLVNGGKYTAGIVSYVAYYGWRHFGSHRDFRMGVWILFATINSCYTTYWDLTMDWSLLQVKGVQYKFLRKELAYSNHILSYYIAIVTNVVIRFIWIFYIPSGGLPAGTRAFIFAILEMLRRVQWNFYRLENEHIGNADQFRVTREVPLPYVFSGEVDSDDEDRRDTPRRPISVRLPTVGSRKSRDRDAEGEEP